MQLLLSAALALNVVSATPPLTGSVHPANPPTVDWDYNYALLDYEAILAGQKQLIDLPLPERRKVMELDRWFRSQQGIVPSETKEECEERLASQSPSSLEEALLDLKCSQRPE